MKFDTPAGNNPIDRQRVVGQPHVRIEGPLKTSGKAVYSYEQNEAAPDAAYGCVVGSAIAKGRIASMDIAAAETAPGVLAVVTAANSTPVKASGFYKTKPLAGPEIQHYHQAIALVVAGTFEQARAASALIRVQYERAKGTFDLAAGRAAAERIKDKPDIRFISGTKPKMTRLSCSSPRKQASLSAMPSAPFKARTIWRCEGGQAFCMT